MVRSITESLKVALPPVLISGIEGAGFTYLCQSCAPFIATSVLHGGLFTGTVSLVGEVTAPFFWKSGCSTKCAYTLSYGLGFITALGASLAVSYLELTVSAVSLAGALALTLLAGIVSTLAKRAMPSIYNFADEVKDSFKKAKPDNTTTTSTLEPIPPTKPSPAPSSN